MATAITFHKQIDRSFNTQQAEAAQDLVVVFDSGGVAVIHRDGHLKGGDKGSTALRSHSGGAKQDLGISFETQGYKLKTITCQRSGVNSTGSQLSAW